MKLDDTYFWSNFTIAESNENDLKNIINTDIEKYKDDIKAAVELAVILNAKAYCNISNSSLFDLYCSSWHTLDDYIFDNYDDIALGYYKGACSLTMWQNADSDKSLR